MDDNVCLTTNDDNAETNELESIESILSNGDFMRELGTAGVSLARVELNIACSSEKLVNLNILMMHVATKESDFETFSLEQEHGSDDSLDFVLDLDLLSGILESEIRELDTFLADIQSEILNTREIISSCENVGEAFTEMKDKLGDSEELLKESQKQVSEMLRQSDEFQKTLLSFCGEANWNGDKGINVSQTGHFFNAYGRIKMQSAEQQRRILNMLEKSLARELNLEKKLTESRLIEEELKLKLHSIEQEAFSVEDDLQVVWERLLESDNIAEVMTGISEDLTSRLHKSDLNLSVSAKRESALKLQFHSLMEKLNSKEISLQDAKLHELITRKADSLEENLKESELQLPRANGFDMIDLKQGVEDLRDKYYEAVTIGEIAESKGQWLEEANASLNEELCFLKENSNTSEKVILLEEQLRNSEIHLQNAWTSGEALQEKQNLLDSTIVDMETLIQELKLKVSISEMRAESTEDKCAKLCESNADLYDELKFQRTRLETLEKSLHQAERAKMETAKGIYLQAKVITDLVTQLAIERDRVYKQISSLVEDNSVLVQRMRQANNDPCMVTKARHEENGSSKNNLTSSFTKENKQVKELSTNDVEVDQSAKPEPTGLAQRKLVDSTSTRTTDERVLNFNHVLVAILILLISIMVYFVLQENLALFVK